MVRKSPDLIMLGKKLLEPQIVILKKLKYALQGLTVQGSPSVSSG